MNALITYKDAAQDPKDSASCAFIKLLDSMFDEENKNKIIWSIGAIYAGYTSILHKHVIIIGPPATGKSTLLNLIFHYFSLGSMAVSNVWPSSLTKKYAAIPDYISVAIEHDGLAGSTYVGRPKCFVFTALNIYANDCIVEDNSNLIYVHTKPDAGNVPKDAFDQLAITAADHLKHVINFTFTSPLLSMCEKHFRLMGPTYYDTKEN